MFRQRTSSSTFKKSKAKDQVTANIGGPLHFELKEKGVHLVMLFGLARE